ncbi:MAG: hypothetical protein MI724_04910 [Spirochaetales bacterium]|nr:hypothetical protein [Spirochaetales bacterium]
MAERDLLNDILDWLAAGDVSIRYQTYRDLLDDDRPDLRERIGREGWGARFLECRNRDGSWGGGFYQPVWTSSHYTLLDLKTLGVVGDHPAIRESIRAVTERHKGPDGGINPSGTIKRSDVCINGMFLNYACYFGEDEADVRSVVDFILDQRMSDGGFNCRKNRSGARHSSLHSTISVLEGVLEYSRNGYEYRLDELERAAGEAREFILAHRLYKSDRTGEIIHPEFLKLSFPTRWKYNILRALDYFQRAEVPWDGRMADALAALLAKRRADGRWPLEAAHPGKTHLVMERSRTPSRWNTLAALRVLRAYG